MKSTALPVILLFAACSSPAPSTCEPGRVLACGVGACTQTCLPGGTWGACVCGDGGAPDALPHDGSFDAPADHADDSARDDLQPVDATDAWADEAEAGPACAYPSAPYGSAPGSILRPFELDACANWAPGHWRFDQADFCTSRATFVSISAIWCVPCQNETSQLEAQVTQRYVGMGVRVVQVLVQNADRSSVTAEPCRAWVSRFGLTIPELMDPAFLTQPYVPGAAFPGNLVIDSRGVVRYRHYGTETGLAEIRRQIDLVLMP